MNKTEFLVELTARLSPLPWEEISDRWDYYSEMIDDRMEDGLTEDEAVAELGSVDEVAGQILSDIPLSTLVKEKIRPKRRLRTAEIALLVLGSPIWLSLLIAVFAVVFSLYVSLWAAVISLWAVFVSLAACFLGGVAACVILSVSGSAAPGLALLAAGLLCAGLSVFLFYGCRAATKGMLLLTKNMATRIKICFIGKEAAQ